jgi:hypothetical protein
LQAKSYLAAHSHFYQLFLRFWRAPEIKSEKSHLDHHLVELFRVPPRDELKEGIEITCQLLRKIKLVGESMKAKTAIFLIPLPLQVSDEEADLFVRASHLRPQEFMLDHPQRVIKDIAHMEGIGVIDLLLSFRAWIQKNKQPLYLERDGHWNEQGHAVAADKVAHELMERGLIPFSKNLVSQIMESRRLAKQRAD